MVPRHLAPNRGTICRPIHVTGRDSKRLTHPSGIREKQGREIYSASSNEVLSHPSRVLSTSATELNRVA
jgi:hypothetical protein